jgi:hypothetical protein
MSLLEQMRERFNSNRYERWCYYDEECESWTTGMRIKESEKKEHFEEELFEI